MTAPTFTAYLSSLGAVSPQAVGGEPEALALCLKATGLIEASHAIDRAPLATLVRSDPSIVPVLGAIVGLSQERLKTWLQSRFLTAGWVNLGRSHADELLAALDEDLDLIATLKAQAARQWTWADVLARTMSSRYHAGSSVKQGRDLEDAVEAEITALGLPFTARTRFVGSNGQTAPADFAIPAGGGALIAIAVKGFDSTGSKLSDATREIEQMVQVKTARQYIFAVVDGLGWLRRQGDLRRIHSLWERQLIDGLYAKQQLGDLQKALAAAAKRVDLLD